LTRIRRQHLGIYHDADTRQIIEQKQDLGSIVQVAAGQFADHVRVSRNLRIIAQRRESRITVAQVIDPDGRIDEHHSAAARLRGPDVAYEDVVKDLKRREKI